ncbi:MAG TPA: hypothetical protein VEX15_14035 [Nocardioidaceae bacterium]|nr:hypothetical protein [Nocardioidaceae bacterium]
MRTAATEYGAWLLSPDLVRLRSAWISAFRQWDRVAPLAPDAVLTDDQRTKLHDYHEAETAYFAQCRTVLGD